MALTIECNDAAPISLEEFHDAVSRDLDVRDLESLASLGPRLHALANNRTFIVEKMNAELLRADGFQPVNPYSAQTLLLGWGTGWFIRANMWEPVSSSAPPQDWQNRLYSYLLPHDHNFSFLTVGYSGPGYSTTIYEYDPEAVKGRPGERVDLRFLERTTLPQGKVMMYRACRDVHNQEHPREFSISLNLMVASDSLYAANQYMFDLEKGQIVRALSNSTSGRLLLCRMARHYGNPETCSILEKLAASHPSAAVRASSLDSLATLQPEAARRLWEKATADSDESLRTTARSVLRTMDQA